MPGKGYNNDVESSGEGLGSEPSSASSPAGAQALGFSGGGSPGAETLPGPSLEDSTFKNGGYAGDESVCERVKRSVIPRVEAIRQQRVTMEEYWADSWRVWKMNHDKQGYIGRSNLYVPVIRKAMETVVAMLSSSLFPTDDIIDATARPDSDPSVRELAVGAKDLLQHDLLVRAKLKQEAKVWLRQLIVTGTSPLKSYWRKDRARVKKIAHKDMMILGRAVPMGGEYEEDTYLYNGPVVSTCDLFNWYIWPEKARTVEEAEFIFQIMELSADELRDRADRGVYNKDAVEEAIKAGGQVRANVYEIEMLARRGFQPPPESVPGQRPPDEDGQYSTPVRIVEVWCRMVLPGGTSRGYRSGEPEPSLVTFAGNNIVLRAIPNPFRDKMPPFVVGRLNETTDNFYGTGLGALGSGLQKLINDQVNQAVDVGAYCINPVVKRSLVGATGPLPAMRPGVIWNVMNPADIDFMRPPWELAKAGMDAAQTTMGMAYDFLSAPPILQGNVPVGRGAKTARGMGILQNNSMTPLQDIVEDLEQQVFVPLLERVACLERQFRKAPIPVEDLVFRWLASRTAMNQQVRAQQMVSLLQIAGSFMPLLQQFGKTINPEPMLKQLITDGYGIRNPEQIIVDSPMMAPGMVPGGGPGGPPPTAPGQDQGDDSNVHMRQMSQEGGNAALGAMGGGIPGLTSPTE